MAEGDSPPVDIELLLVYLQLAHALQRLGGECLVEFDQVHVIDAQSRALQDFTRGGNGAESHVGGINARDGRCDDTRARMQAKLLGTVLCHHHQRRCTVVNTCRVACSYAAIFAKGGFQGCQFFNCGIGAWVLIDGDYGGLTLFLWDGYRQDLGGETAGLLGGYGSLLTAQREGVLIGATDAVLFGDVLGRFPHAVGMMYGG